MSFYGGNQNGGQPGSAQQQQMGRQQNVQSVLTPQLFNINVNPNQLQNFFNDHNSSHNQLQMNAAAAAAAANAPSILLQSQQTQSFPVNLINDQLGVSQLISSATVSQGQMQGLPISMSSALNFPQTIQVHAQTPPPQQSMQQQAQQQNQQSKQRVFTGVVSKIHDNFGFIDDEVFFQMGVVKGVVLPKEGDRVLVEADFNASMPFKWNATRVQIVNIGGGLSSSLNSMSNMNSNQQQHMGFNTSVGIQKQSNAPPPPVLTSQAGPIRPHAQPVSIVSNPHSVYSGASGTVGARGRTAVVGNPVPPVNSMGTPSRDSKRPSQMNLPLPPDPPSFISNNSVGGLIASDRDLDRGRERDRSRERGRDRSRDRSRERIRERSRERIRQRSRERSRDRTRDRSRDKLARNRSRSRERLARERSRDRSRDRVLKGGSRERSRERNVRGRSPDRTLPARLRSRSKERHVRERSSERRDRSKRERTPDKQRERSRERIRDKEVSKEKDHRRKSSSPANKSKDSSKRDIKIKDKDKQKLEKGKSNRDRSPPGSQINSQASERSKRSRSKESVKTDKGHTVEKSRSRSSSPRRKSISRPAPRYGVEVPKFSIDMKEINVKEIQRRYPNLYVPSDFFLAKSTWMDTFPMHAPFELGHSCPIQIMRKGVQKIEIPDPAEVTDRFKDIPDILEPADSSYTFKAKVMLPTMSSLETIYKKACGLAGGSVDATDNFQHLDRLISFLVGVKTSKHEVMALGGPWSVSLDGANPQSDPQTLINTSIRCVRALSGINLSHCKHWYRFMELYYKRSNCLETVVYFLPDVWSCLPGTKEWSKLKSLYKYALRSEKPETLEKIAEETEAVPAKDASQSLISAEENKESQPMDDFTVSEVTEAVKDNVSDSNAAADICNTNDTQEDVLNGSGLLVIDEAASPVREDSTMEATDSRRNADNQEHPIPLDGPGLDSELLEGGLGKPQSAVGSNVLESNQVEDLGSGNISATDKAEDTQGAHMGFEDTTVDDKDICKGVTENGTNDSNHPVPTHFSLLSPKNMNVAQLKEELGRRKINAKGLKSQLITRLVKALKDEEVREKEEEERQSETIEVSLDIQSDTAGIETRETTVEGNNDSVSSEANKQPVAIDEEISKDLNEQDDLDEERCIRLVNPSLILEEHDDDCSVEDGELKDDTEIEGGSSQILMEYENIFSKFPPDTFPIIKPGMKEEEVKMWERRYALPKNPRLLVYPSSSAKSGNFDCLSMTLGLLRDYRIIDKKEDNFEVSLFSEFFHEMLQRDFAFRIYREIIAEAGKVSSDDISSVEKDVGKDEKVDKENGEPVAKKRKLSTESSVVQSVSKKTTDPFLLLSFLFFDITNCGYITETDLEDLISCIGIGLSRAQIRKAVQKVIHKGTLHYRKWTDRPEKLKQKNKTETDELRALAQGNKACFPVFVFPDEDSGKSNISSNVCENEEGLESIIVSVDGKSVDVRKLLDQLTKCEKDLSVAESSLNVMKNSLSESKSQVADLKKVNETLKEELAKIKETLKKTEGSEKSAKESVEVFKRSTERFIDRIKDFVKLPSSSSKEKSETSKESAKSKEKHTDGIKEKLKSNHDSEQQATIKEAASCDTEEVLTKKERKPE